MRAVLRALIRFAAGVALVFVPAFLLVWGGA